MKVSAIPVACCISGHGIRLQRGTLSFLMWLTQACDLWQIDACLLAALQCRCLSPGLVLGSGTGVGNSEMLANKILLSLDRWVEFMGSFLALNFAGILRRWKAALENQSSSVRVHYKERSNTEVTRQNYHLVIFSNERQTMKGLLIISVER